MKEKEIQVGDTVLIHNTGAIYGSYDVMASVMGLTNWSRSSYYNSKDTLCRVLVKCQHLYRSDKCMLLGVENIETGVQFIIGETGVKFHSRNLVPQHLFDFD